jgi:hypothetical protein
MTVLMTIFIGLPTFLYSLVSTKDFKKSMLRLIAIAVFGCCIDLALITMAIHGS